MSMYTHTHRIILWPAWILSGTTQVSWHQKDKTNLDLLDNRLHNLGTTTKQTVEDLERSCKMTVKYVNLTGRMLWIVVDGISCKG